MTHSPVPNLLFPVLHLNSYHFIMELENSDPHCGLADTIVVLPAIPKHLTCKKPIKASTSCRKAFPIRCSPLALYSVSAEHLKPRLCIPLHMRHTATLFSSEHRPILEGRLIGSPSSTPSVDVQKERLCRRSRRTVDGTGACKLNFMTSHPGSC